MITSKETSTKISKRLKDEWNNGLRNGHSEKLKTSWDRRNRNDQSLLLTKTLTKYYYTVDNDEKHLTYKDLINMGLKSAVSLFHRTKSNQCKLKGFVIIRHDL
jgi:hypothetical protein